MEGVKKKATMVRLDKVPSPQQTTFVAKRDTERGGRSVKEIAGAAQRTAIISEPLQDWRGSDVIADVTIFCRNTLCILFKTLAATSADMMQALLSAACQSFLGASSVASMWFCQGCLSWAPGSCGIGATGLRRPCTGGSC